MKRRLVLPALLTAMFACERPAEPGDAGLARMIVQPRFEPYEAAPFFPDGKVMRAPPAGTVPWAPSPAAAAADTAMSRERLERGRTRFLIYCAACHGPDGRGQSVIARNLEGGPPPSLVRPDAPRGAAELYDHVANGIGRMPSYAAELPPEDRRAVVAFLQMMQRRAVQ